MVMVVVKGGRGYHVMELAGGQNCREERLIRGKGIIGWLDQSIILGVGGILWEQSSPDPIFLLLRSFQSCCVYEQYPCAQLFQ